MTHTCADLLRGAQKGVQSQNKLVYTVFFGINTGLTTVFAAETLLKIIGLGLRPCAPCLPAQMQACT